MFYPFVQSPYSFVQSPLSVMAKFACFFKQMPIANCPDKKLVVVVLPNLSPCEKFRIKVFNMAFQTVIPPFNS